MVSRALFATIFACVASDCCTKTYNYNFAFGSFPTLSQNCLAPCGPNNTGRFERDASMIVWYT